MPHLLRQLVRGGAGQLCGTSPLADVPQPAWPGRHVPQADAPARFHLNASR